MIKCENSTHFIHSIRMNKINLLIPADFKFIAYLFDIYKPNNSPDVHFPKNKQYPQF